MNYSPFSFMKKINKLRPSLVLSREKRPHYIRENHKG